MNACNCCAAPFHGPPLLEYKFISASRAKCGRGPFRNGNSCYTSVSWFESAGHFNFSNPCPCSSVFKSISGSFGYGIVGMGATGAISASATQDVFGVEASRSCSGSVTQAVVDGEPGDPVVKDCSDVEFRWGCGGPEIRCGGGFTAAAGNSASLSDLYTTEDLQAYTTGSLPEWPARWFTYGVFAAYRNLSPDESSYSISRIKWRLKHAPSGTCYLKVWLRRRFTPEGGGVATYTPLETYEWIGSGNPCIPDKTKSVDHPDNTIYGEESEEQEPAEDGATAIEIQKYSCIRGYIPPDDGSANGFPIP